MRTIYSNAESWNGIPEPLRRWAHGSSYTELLYGEEPPPDAVWEGHPQAGEN